MSGSGHEQEHKTPRATPSHASKAGGSAQTPGGRENRLVYLLDRMAVRDLAIVLQLKPFKIIADLMEMKLFKGPDDLVDFETASRIAQKHGYRAERPPPGVLVL